MGRVILAALVAAIVMFAWAATAHNIPQIGQIGIKTMPAEAEAAVLGAVKGATNDADGLYVAPMSAMENMTGSGPSLMIAYRANVPYEVNPVMMGSEFAIEFIQALILAFLLAQFTASFGARVMWATAAGVMVAISTNGSYHIWWGFPLDYTLVAMGIQIVQYLLAGIVMGLLLPRAPAAATD